MAHWVGGFHGSDQLTLTWMDLVRLAFGRILRTGAIVIRRGKVQQ